jgi:hypothetical protein
VLCWKWTALWVLGWKMNIQIHANEVGQNLVDETHDIHACFFNAYFDKLVKEYKGGYNSYLSDMAKALSSDSLLVMEEIVKTEKQRLNE